MAKATRGRNRPTLVTSPHNIVIELDNFVHDVDYCRLETYEFEPDRNSFQFRQGRWIAVHERFPIDADYDLDIIIIVSGNPGTTPNMRVTIDNKEPVELPANYAFRHNGRTIFDYQIPI